MKNILSYQYDKADSGNIIVEYSSSADREKDEIELEVENDEHANRVLQDLMLAREEYVENSSKDVAEIDLDYNSNDQNQDEEDEEGQE